MAAGGGGWGLGEAVRQVAQLQGGGGNRGGGCAGLQVGGECLFTRWFRGRTSAASCRRRATQTLSAGRRGRGLSEQDGSGAALPEPAGGGDDHTGGGGAGGGELVWQQARGGRDEDIGLHSRGGGGCGLLPPDPAACSAAIGTSAGRAGEAGERAVTLSGGSGGFR